MKALDVLNHVKWQMLARLPKGGIYERVKGSILNSDLSTKEKLYYVYWLDINKSLLTKYLFGTYRTSFDDYNDFYKWMDNNYLENDYYNFVHDGLNVKLPVPSITDYKCYKAEFLDIIMPYLIADAQKSNLPFLEGPYEYGNVSVRPESTVLDLGANYGMFSAYASSKDCQVYAFEPNSSALKYLRQTALLNNNISVFNECISSVKGRVPFYFDERVPSCSCIIDESTKNNVIYMDSNTVDDFVDTNNLLTVDFIKADIEGAERQMLIGALRTLKEFAPDLAICCYHKLDDISVLKKIILDANNRYEIVRAHKKIYAKVRR